MNKNKATDLQTGVTENRFDFPALFNKYGLFIILLGLVIISTIISKGIFIKPANLVNILIQISVIGILALGQTLVILTSGIDLSVGSVMVLCAIIAGFNQNLGIIPFIVIAVGIGLIAGMANGILVAKLKIPAFIATLGMMSIARGLAATTTRGSLIELTLKGDNIFGRDRIANLLPNAVIIWLLVFCLIYFVLNRTKWGYYIYSLGGNEKATYLSGVNTGAAKILVYTLSGLCCGVAALIDTSRVALANPFTGDTANMDSIAAVVIGGTSLMGGVGTLTGTLIGAMILGVISNLMNILNISQYFQMTVKGLIIIAAVAVKIVSQSKGVSEAN